MKSQPSSRNSGFTLLETVIAIGVLAVLITAFLAAFGPAMSGIRKSINVQEADRMASTLEQELANLRSGQETSDIKTGFDKSFYWIKQTNDAANALFVYQYRGNPSKHRADSTLEPVTQTGGVPGKDFIVQPMIRRLSDPLFVKDIAALEGPVLLVKTTQLIFNKGQGLAKGLPGEIKDPQLGTNVNKPDDYKEAVIAFYAEFYSMPTNSDTYFTGSAFTSRFKTVKYPIFTRNLAVRR